LGELVFEMFIEHAEFDLQNVAFVGPQVFERMLFERLQRDTITHSAAMSACQKGGQRQQALDVFEKCVEKACSETASLTVLPSVFATF